MIPAKDPSAARTFDADDVRVFVVAPTKLAMYDSDNDSAWLAADQPTDLRDWR